MDGVIRWWNYDRGWGFAQVDGEADVFVHHSAIKDDGDVHPGVAVSFEVKSGYVGMVATGVKRKKKKTERPAGRR